MNHTATTDLDTLHLVDPALRPLLDLFPTVIASAETLPAMRARQLPVMPAPEDGVTIEERAVPGPAGAPDVGVHIYRPAERRGEGAILHIHGGGFVAGAAKDFAFAIRPIAAALGCVIVSVDYRLAPEAASPAAVEDCYAALAWTIANAGDLGVDPARIGVMGESAGGGLAAALALLARDRGEHTLAFQHLTYPMLDDRTCIRPPHPFAGEFIWTAASNRFGWTSLLGKEPGGDNVSPYAAPARAGDLAGLPPTYLMTGALDLFLDEDLDYARRLLAAGVPTELHVYPGAVHGFDIAPGVPLSERARADRLAALARALALP